MEERRDNQAESAPGARRTPLPAATKLSPVQRAKRACADHSARCGQCSDTDRQRCTVGEQLWEAWTVALDDAYRRLHGESK